MFSLTRPTRIAADRAVQDFSQLESRPALLEPRRGLQLHPLTRGFAHDRSQTLIGQGFKAFHSAASAFREWKQFDLGWVRVANPDANIKVGQIVAVEVKALGLWSLNLSEIVNVIEDSNAFGFTYKTTSHHAEEGEERFLLTFDPATSDVRYELEAVSRPQHWLARLGYPATRAFQHKFAFESHNRLRHVVAATSA